MALPGEKRSKDRAPSGPKKVKNRNGPNIDTQNAPDTSLLGSQPEGSKRQERSKKKGRAISDYPRRLAGGKKLHHCGKRKHRSDKDCAEAGCLKECSGCGFHRSTYNGSICWVCRKTEIRLAQIAARQAGGIANRALFTQQRPSRVTKSVTRRRMESLRLYDQVVWANRRRKVISAKTLEDVPETTDADTVMDVCSTPNVAESDTYMGDIDDETDDEPRFASVDTGLDVKGELRFNPANTGLMCNEDQRTQRVRDAEEILKLVREGLDRLI